VSTFAQFVGATRVAFSRETRMTARHNFNEQLRVRGSCSTFAFECGAIRMRCLFECDEFGEPFRRYD
jgi:hypothetical protein